jgi:hypothetical protein
LVAGNGSPNFGDELIVQHWLRFYRESGYEGPITVDGKGSKRSERLIRGFGNVEFVSRIPRHADGITGTYDDFYRIGTAYAKKNSADYKGVIGFHLLGGGYASAAWKNATKLLGSVTGLGRELSVPVVATGLGVAPFKLDEDGDRAPWAQILSGCEIFECRDQDSYDVLSNLTEGTNSGLCQGLDDCFLYPVSVKPHSGKWLHLSGFSIHNVFGREQVIDSLFAGFDKVVFWTCSTHDASVHSEISKLHPEVMRVTNEGLLNGGLPLGPDDFMVTGRFHPHLLAARTGISGYYTVASDFYRTKHGLVAALGSAFQPIRKEANVFRNDGSRMVLSDASRVEAKREVARRVLNAMKLDLVDV